MAHSKHLAALAALALGLAACPRERPRAPRPDAGQAGVELPPRPPAEGPAAQLPYPGLAGWTMSSTAEVYGRGDLERLVDGGAEVYHRFGYGAAAVAEYRRAGEPSVALRVELYDMGSPLGAFGLVASEIAELRDPSAAESPGVLDLREAGTLGPGALTFYRGDLVVRLVLQDLSPEATEESLDALTREHLPPFARALVRRLPGTSALPEELRVLAAEGRVRRSEQLHPEHLLGLAAAGRGVSALYGDPGPRLRLGVALDADEARARELFAALGRAMSGATAVADLGDEATTGRLDPLGTALVARQGATLVVVAAERPADEPRLSALASLAGRALAPEAEAGASAPASGGP